MTRPDEAFAKSYRRFMDYKPIPTLTSIKSPLLAILTPDDESIDALETESILKALGDMGHKITLKMYPGYDHSMHRIGFDNNPLRLSQFPEDYFSFQAIFIKKIDVSGSPDINIKTDVERRQNRLILIPK